MGMTLSHEHIMSNFGAPLSDANTYDEDALYAQVVPYLKGLKNKGIKTIFDCTTAYFGRRVDILMNIADSTGLNIITNTGYYGAANDVYIPKHAYTESSETISHRWIDEFENGIDGTAIRPGFIKLAFDDGLPSEIDLKLFEAGVFTHKKTGLTLAVHTGANQEAITKMLNLLKKHSVDSKALIWVHANKMGNTDAMLEMAKQGVFISLDGVDANNCDTYIAILQEFKRQKLFHKILMSHDGNSFPKGGPIRPYDAITNVLIPRMKAHGFLENEIRQLLINNPKEAFGIQIKNSY